MKLVSGGAHTCVVKTGGAPQCWGASYSGEVGDGGYDSRAAPVSVAGNPSVIDIASGAQHTCAVVAGGAVSCWGDDRSGQLGDGILADALPVAPLLPCP
jgi:hypothetical protein